MRRHLLFGFLAWALVCSSAQAAYIGSPPLFIGTVNLSGQPIGQQNLGQPTLPTQTAIVPPLAAFPTPPAVLGKNAILPDIFGRTAIEITDGLQVATLTQPYRGVGAAQPAIAVALSPNPAPQCPFTQAFSITANTTVITNPGGKNIHVCLVLLINGATAQSVTLLEGTGTACATNPINWLGAAGATAALAVNGGFSVPGNWINYPMQKNGDNVCVLVSGSTNVSGSITYGLY